MPRKRTARWQTGAGILCAGLLYGLVGSPLGFRVPCLFYRLTGLRCPGCGMTDLCLALLRGRPWEAARWNWGVTMVSPALAWLGVQAWRGSGCGKRERALAAGLVVYLLLWGAARNFWGI